MHLQDNVLRNNEQEQLFNAGELQGEKKHVSLLRVFLELFLGMPRITPCDDCVFVVNIILHEKLRTYLNGASRSCTSCRKLMMAFAFFTIVN